MYNAHALTARAIPECVYYIAVARSKERTNLCNGQKYAYYFRSINHHQYSHISGVLHMCHKERKIGRSREKGFRMERNKSIKIFIPAGRGFVVGIKELEKMNEKENTEYGGFKL